MGTVRRLAVTTNVSATKASSGDVGAIISLTPGQSGAFRNFQMTMQDFWKLDNVAYDAAHVDFPYSGAYCSSGNTAGLSNELYGGKYVAKFTYSYSGNPGGYAGFYYGAPSGTSSGTVGFIFDFYSLYAGQVQFTAKDSVGSSWVCTKNVSAGWQTFSIDWIGVAGTAFAPSSFAHPVAQFYVDAASPNAGTFYLDRAYYGTIKTMADLSPTVVNGVQFGFIPLESSGEHYDFYVDHISVDQVMRDGNASSADLYKGIPRWTYKWMGNSNDIAFGAWRGPSAPGYLWLPGWTASGIVNSDTGLAVSEATLQFMKDAQDAFTAIGGSVGPFAPRYGRPSWEALATAGWVTNSYHADTYNKFYFPDSDDWYGYEYRALLSVAGHYYMTGAATAKTILDKWMTWIDSYIIADGAYWAPPSEFYKNGTVGYSYRPVYAYATIAAACIYKYWVDGDAIALKWYRRLLDDMFARKRQVSTGTLAGVSRTTEGQNYTSASIIFTVNSGATAPGVTPIIAGGKITRYRVNSVGVGITSISAVVSGDGSGATCNPYLTDILVGAFSNQPTGWEQAEVFNTYGMVVCGARPGGTANYTLVQAGDLSSASYTGKSWLVNSQTVNPGALKWRPDGGALFVTDAASGAIYEYTPLTAWEVNSLAYSGRSLNVSSWDLSVRGIEFSPDGTRMYFTGFNSVKVYQFSCLSSWQVNSASYTGKSLSTVAQDGKPHGIRINNSGTTLLVVGYTTDHVFGYRISSAYNIDTGVYSGDNLYYGATTFGYDIDVPVDGSRLLLTSPNSNALLQFDMSSAWGIGTAVYSGHTVSVFSRDNAVTGCALSADGSKFYFGGNAHDAVFEFVSSGAAYTANDLTAFTGLYNFFANNAKATRPAMLNSAWIPYHEFDIDTYHSSASIEFPMVRDTHVKGALWTETLAPMLYAAAEYSRFSSIFSGAANTTWMQTLYKFVQELSGEAGGSTFLAPTPRISNGLMDAYTDILGGEPLETTKNGKMDGAIYTVVNSLRQVIIPASAGGGNVTFVRGAWPKNVNFRYAGFMADVDPNYVGSKDNYADITSGATAANIYSGGVLSTVVNLTAGINSGDQVQVFYAYRSGAVSAAGQAMAGWPYLHVESYQGTANDGDNYMMWALDHCARVSVDSRYSNTGIRIGNALLAAGKWSSNVVPFNMPLEATEGQFGMYTYNSSSTPFSMGIEAIPSDPARYGLRLQSSVYVGNSPANYAGFGMWPSLAVSTTSPFSAFNIALLWYSVTDLSSLAASTTAQFDRQLIIGTSDYSTHVLNWPNIERQWDRLTPKTISLPLANEDGAFNFFNTYPERMRNPVSIAMGFTYAGMKTIFHGTVDAVVMQGGACTLTLADKVRNLTDRKIGDTTTPVVFTSSAYLIHDMAWIVCTSLGGFSAVQSTSNPDIDWQSFNSWSSVFSSDNVRVHGYFTGQKPLEVLNVLAMLTQSAIYEEGGKIKFNRFSLADAAVDSLDESKVLDNVATLDGRQLINRSWVSGDFNVTSNTFAVTVFTDNSDSQIRYGLREDLAANQNVWLVDSVSALGLSQRNIETFGILKPTYRVSTAMVTIMRTIGEVIYLHDAQLGVADTFRIMGDGLDSDKGTRYFDVNRTQFKSAFYLDINNMDNTEIVLV